MRSRKVAIHDVAEAAGVSSATVSLVYNDKGKIAAGTRKKVLEAGERLGYQPGWMSKAFRSGRTHVIGVVVRHSESAIWEQTYLPYYRGIIAGAAMEALTHRYSIAAVRTDEAGRLTEPFPLDGLIVIDPLPTDPIITNALQQGMAVVADGGYPGAEGHPRVRSVRSAIDEAIPAALDAFLNLGASRPAFLRGYVDDEYTNGSQRHYENWCLAHDIEPAVAIMGLDHTPIESARELLSGAYGTVDAVHCLNPTYASAMLEAAAEAKLSVPEDLAISVFGEANSAPDPRLMYLDDDPIEGGALCARTLIELIEGDAPEDVMTPIPLVLPKTR